SSPNLREATMTPSALSLLAAAPVPARLHDLRNSDAVVSADTFQNTLRFSGGRSAAARITGRLAAPPFHSPCPPRKWDYEISFSVSSDARASRRHRFRSCSSTGLRR